MKYFKNCQGLLSISLYVFFILGTSSGLCAQEDVYIKLARFSIVVETSGDAVKLTCSDGCEWKQLSFTSSIESEPQGVDQFGLRNEAGNLVKKGSVDSGFLFTLKRTLEGISLEGKEGTIWTSLTFICPGGKCVRQINQWGESDLKKE